MSFMPSSPALSQAFVDKAELLFLSPTSQYSWEQIVTGASVRSELKGIRRFCAVGQNTFRGFHKINKSLPGAKDVFVGYFLGQKTALMRAMSSITTKHDLDMLCNRICDDIRTCLANCLPAQLRSYNKVRKPVDLYFEHLVAMAVELNELRPVLVPLLHLPLDSQILAHPELFTEQELAAHGLARSSTYKDIIHQQTYTSLQTLLSNKAAATAASQCHSFHVIYFDLIWNDRFRNWGGNLFETNP